MLLRYQEEVGMREKIRKGSRKKKRAFCFVILFGGVF